jgi:molybdopterin synthase sulfur carrier subunit
MIKVEVRLYATLRKYSLEAGVGEPLILEMPEESRVADLLSSLGVPSEEVKVIFVNNQHQEEGYALRGGERVGIFPPVAGG